MDLSPYLLSGFRILPKIDVTFPDVTDPIPALFNQSDHNDSNVLGGFEPDNQAILAIETTLLTTPKSLKGKVLTIGTEKWRVITVKFGQTITHLTIISDNKS